MTTCAPFAKAIVTSVFLLCIGCVHYVESHAIEVKVGKSIDERLEIAHSIVTPARLDRLKMEIKGRVSGATDAQLQSLDLKGTNSSVKGLDGTSRESVLVTVIVQHDNKFDPKPIIKAAIAILEPEVNRTSGGQ